MKLARAFLIDSLCCALFFAAGKSSANDSISSPIAAPATLSLQASATNTSPGFMKYLYTFPLPTPALLTGLTGSISMTSHGQNFAEALISIHEIPPGHPCPRNGEVYATYPAVSAHYPNMRSIAQFIIKMPSGVNAATIPIQITLPAGIPVSGSLVVTLDGSVLKSGGAFVMTSNLTAQVASPTSTESTVKPAALDDEFCFGRSSGGERATTKTSPDAAFMKVVPVTETEELLALYGDVSDSAFGPAFCPPVGPGHWTISNDYYVYHHCTLHAGVAGPSDFYATIPADAIHLDSIKMEGDGQVSLQQAVYQAVSGVVLHRGDCLVHLIHLNQASDQGGIDAENQVFALVRPVGKAEANPK